MQKKGKYRIVCETLVCEEGSCVCYGMHREDDAIPHISTDRTFVQLVADLVNRLELEPHKARDLIEQLLP